MNKLILAVLLAVPLVSANVHAKSHGHGGKHSSYFVPKSSPDRNQAASRHLQKQEKRIARENSQGKRNPYLRKKKR